MAGRAVSIVDPDDGARKMAIFREPVPIDIDQSDGIEVDPFFSGERGVGGVKTRLVRRALSDENGLGCCCGNDGTDECESVCGDNCGLPDNFTSIWNRCFGADCQSDGAQGDTSQAICSTPPTGWTLNEVRGTRCCETNCPCPINIDVTSVTSGRQFSFLGAKVAFGFGAAGGVAHGPNSFLINYEICDSGLEAGTSNGAELTLEIRMDLTALQPCYPLWDFPCSVTPSFTPGGGKVPRIWNMTLNINYRLDFRTNTRIFRDTGNGCCELIGGDIVERVQATHVVEDDNGFNVDIPSFDWNEIKSAPIQAFMASVGEPLGITWDSESSLGIGTRIPWNGPGCAVCAKCP